MNIQTNTTVLILQLIADVLEEDAEPGPNSSMPFEFVEGASTIALELPSDRIDGWKMVKLNSLKVYCSTITV